jgi:hypothetical protein
MWASYAFFVGVPILLAAAPLFLGFDWSAYMAENWHLLLMGPLLAFIGFPLLWLWNLRSHRQSSPASQGQQTYFIDERGIELSGPLYRTNLEWPAITRVVETRLFFLIYFGKQAAYFVPKRILSAVETSELRELIRRNVHGKISLQNAP